MSRVQDWRQKQVDWDNQFKADMLHQFNKADKSMDSIMLLQKDWPWDVSNREVRLVKETFPNMYISTTRGRMHDAVEDGGGTLTVHCPSTNPLKNIWLGCKCFLSSMIA